METVRIGIIGSRFAAGLHAHAYHRLPQAKVVAAAAIDNLKPFCKQYRIPNAYDDYRQMLKRDDIDLVSICVPNYLHKRIAVNVAKAGKAIICEKPLATTVADAKAIVAACNKAKVRLMYAEDWCFAPALLRAKEIVKEGALGQVLYVKAKETHPGSHSVYAQRVKFCGGGALIHLAVHPIGFVRWFTGQEIVEVTAMTTGGGKKNLKHSGFEGEDWSAALCRMGNGTFALVEGNYITCGGLDDTVEVYGSRGTLKIDLAQGSPIRAFSLKGYDYAIEKAEMTTGWTAPAVDEEWNLGYNDELACFVDCVRRGKQPPRGVRGEDGVACLKVVEAIYQSAKTRRAVRV